MNMPYMFVTLDVSRLSGWLNADAACRVTAELMEGDMRGREGVRVEAVGAACTEDPTGLGAMARVGGAPQTFCPCP